MIPIVSAFAGSMASQAVSAFTGSMFAPLARATQVGFNQRFPNVPPPVDWILTAGMRKLMTDAEVIEALEWHGVSLAEREGNGDYHIAWRACLEAQKAVPEIEEVLRYHWLRNEDNVNTRLWLQRAGAQHPWHRDWLLRRERFLTIEEMQYLQSLGQILPDDIRRQMGGQGIIHAQFRDPLMERVQPPAPGEVLALLNRGYIGPGQADNMLHRGGLLRQEERDWFLRLRNQIPGASDIVSFALKEAWDQNTVNRFQYDAEFPPELQYWLRQQGYDWSEDIPGPDGVPIRGVSWARLYWRAHWQVISPSQAYEMQQRLRPERIDRFRAVLPGVRPWTFDDTRQVLKIHDYPLPFRDQLAALAYKVLTRVDVRRMFETGVIDRAETIALYEDMGYVRADATRLTDFLAARDRLAELKALNKVGKAQILKAYKVGTLSKARAGAQLVRLTARTPEAAAEMQAAPIQALEGRAVRDPLIQAQLAAVDADLEADLVAAGVKAIKAAYLKVDLTQQAAEVQLRQLGIQEARIGRYLAAWRVEFMGKGRHLTAAQIVKQYSLRLMTRPEMQRRLYQLGYTPLDTVRMAALADRDLALQTAQDAVKQARTAKERTKARLDVVRAVEGTRRKARTELSRHGTPAQLARWLKKGLIEQEQVEKRLEKMDWPAEDRKRLIEEALQDQAKAAKKSPPGSNGQAQPATNGGP